VQHAFGHPDSPVVNSNPDHGDADAVHHHRDGNTAQEDETAFPESAAEGIRDHEGQGHEREQVAQAAARLGHFQLIGAQVDHVAFQEHADARGPDQEHANVG